MNKKLLSLNSSRALFNTTPMSGGFLTIEANFTQVWSPRSLVVQSDQFELTGDFGASAWFIPLGDEVGVKIFNKVSVEEYDLASLHLQKVVENYKFLRSAMSDNGCKMYIPDVYGFRVVKIVGDVMFGGMNTKRCVLNCELFFSCVFLRRYLPVTRSEFTVDMSVEMDKRFKVDGFVLPRDSFFPARQIGKDRFGNFKLLDVHFNGRKYL